MNAMTDLSRPPSSRKTAEMEVHDARVLIANGVQTCIQLDDQLYYLRITRAGKLILTK